MRRKKKMLKWRMLRKRFFELSKCIARPRACVFDVARKYEVPIHAKTGMKRTMLLVVVVVGHYYVRYDTSRVLGHERWQSPRTNTKPVRDATRTIDVPHIGRYRYLERILPYAAGTGSCCGCYGC